jgi:hypothetical protein
MRTGRTTLLAFALAALPATTLGQVRKDGVNDAFTPCLIPGCAFVVDAVAWYYTPASSYTLNSIRVWFGPQGADRIVDVGIYTDAPAVGGVLLRGAPLNSALARAGFAGPTFAPIDLVGGTTYLVGFVNVLGIGMVTDAPGSVQLPVRSGFGPGAETFPNNLGILPSSSRAMLQFFGPRVSAPVPEPATALLLAPALLLLGAAARRMRRR